MDPSFPSPETKRLFPKGRSSSSREKREKKKGGDVLSVMKGRKEGNGSANPPALRGGGERGVVSRGEDPIQGTTLPVLE